MKRSILIGITFLFVLSGVPSVALAEESTEIAAAVDAPPEIEIIILEDGTEELQKILPPEAYAPLILDERYLAIKVDADQRIQAILEQIEGLADRSTEGELQRQIEQIKMDAEIERLTLLKEDAENRQDDALANELAYEIDHLGRIDEPVIGYQEEQQPQQTIE